MDASFWSWPYARPVLGLLAVVFAFFLLKFLLRQAFLMVKLFLLIGLVAIGVFFYYDHAGNLNSSKPAAGGVDFSADSEAAQTTQRQIYAQIVDSDEKDQFAEHAILEGLPFKYLLKRTAKVTRAEVVKEVNDRTTFENLTDEPDLHRGEAYAPGRGVIIEVSIADLGPEYGLPGYTVLPAIFVNTAHEIYALRILCAPGSKVFEKLDSGIKADKLPVVNLAGLFFKNYAKQPGDPKEQPWVKPLLVCPEIEFVAGEEPREVMKELQDTGYARMLPTTRVFGFPTDERLVLDVALDKDGVKMRALGADAKGEDAAAFISDSVAKVRARLPAEQAAHAAAVVVLKAGVVTDPGLKPVLDALKAAGVTRVAVKLDVVKPNAAGK